MFRYINTLDKVVEVPQVQVQTQTVEEIVERQIEQVQTVQRVVEVPTIHERVQHQQVEQLVEEIVQIPKIIQQEH